MAAGGEENSFFSTGGEASPVTNLTLFSANAIGPESPVLKQLTFKYKYAEDPLQVYKEYVRNEFGQVQVNANGNPLTQFVQNKPLNLMWPTAGIGRSLIQTPDKFKDIHSLFAHYFAKLKKYTKIVMSKLGKTREQYKDAFRSGRSLQSLFPENYESEIVPYLKAQLRSELSALRLIAKDFPVFHDRGLDNPAVVLDIFQFVPIYKEFEVDYGAYLREMGELTKETEDVLKALNNADLATPIGKVNNNGSPTFLNMGGGKKSRRRHTRKKKIQKSKKRSKMTKA
jgi:hypothetical protein